MSLVRLTCPKCGSRRVVEGHCFECWWAQSDWKVGMTPLNVRIDYRRADGTCWRWAQSENGQWFKQVIGEGSPP